VPSADAASNITARTRFLAVRNEKFAYRRKGYTVLLKIFFAPTESSQAAGEAFVNRLMECKEDREPVSGRHPKARSALILRQPYSIRLQRANSRSI